MKISKNESGFTLVELVVVIAILGIVVVIGIARFSKLTDEARLQSDQSIAAAIATTAQAWIAEGDNLYTGNTIDIEELKKSKYLIEGIDYKSQTTKEDFKIDYDPDTNSITVKAGTEQFYPIP